MWHQRVPDVNVLHFALPGSARVVDARLVHIYGEYI
jgi:hypothetical protein